MAKVKKAYFCKNCGFEAPKWLGRCPSCGEWNTFTEEIVARESGSVPANVAGSLPAAKPQRVRDIRESEHRRMDLGNSEVNRVLGGGMVPGSLILLGGEPGIGKSTLSLQLALAANGLKTLYVSGEESAEQIKMRAGRIGIGNDECLIYPETLLENIVNQIGEHRPDLVVIDSIQTIYTDLLDSSAGSVSQIRECAATLLKYAKSTGTSIFIIGHITKDGTIAGPKILEHIVDVVLQFEGDSNNIYRILRGIKNRFGATFEIGVFEMLDAGLRPVGNPSEILLTHYDAPLSGIAVGAERSWKYLKNANMPCMFYVSKTNEDHGDFAAVLSALQEKHGSAVCAVTAPMSDGTGVIDLVHNVAYQTNGNKTAKVAVPAADADMVESLRETPFWRRLYRQLRLRNRAGRF